MGAQQSNGNGHYPMIELKDVSKSYWSAAGEFRALKDVDLEIQAGEFVSVIGKSGSGKSTLLNMITGIDRPTEGGVWVNGTPLHKLDENELAIWRGANMGIVFQFFQLLPALSLLQNVILPMDLAGKYTRRERRQRAEQLLDLVGLSEHGHNLPSMVSGGQQQRAAMARAIANDPPIVIADEPTGNLDTKTAETVFGLFNDLSDQGKTIIIVTHDSGLARRANRTALITDGEIVNEYVSKSLPTLTQARGSLETIPGEVPNPLNFPSGCRYHPRCRLYATIKDPKCRQSKPKLREIAPGHLSRCHFAEDIYLVKMFHGPNSLESELNAP